MTRSTGPPANTSRPRVSDEDVATLLTVSAERLKDFAAQRVTLGPARVTPEAILLDVAPADGLAAIRHCGKPSPTS